MSKTLKTNNLGERPAIRTLLAISLCATMAAFGCTTDRNLGNGDPVVTPGLRTSPIGGNSPGSESPAVPPPMMSSYNGSDALPSVRPRIAPQTTAAEAAAIMAEHQPRVRVLGPASPNSGGRPYYSDRTMYASGQLSNGSSINSTIYNPNPNGAAITSGAGEAIVGGAVATVDTTGAATVVPTTSGAVTPTNAAIPVPAGFAAVGTLSPTAAAVVNPPASISSSSTLATVSSSRTAGGTVTAATPTATTATTTATAATTAATTTVGTGMTSVVNPIRVTNTNGRIVVSNTSSSRQQ
jgi:hypothetical protein